jgi:pimeloyl-ACP methyl ester carboxylesterase
MPAGTEDSSEHAPHQALAGIVLDRVSELTPVRLRFRDVPGLDGPIVHVAHRTPGADHTRDHGGPGASGLLEQLGAAFAPRFRVVSVALRPSAAYQTQAAELAAFLDQFGFSQVVLIGEQFSALPALCTAAWFPGRAAGVIFVDPSPGFEGAEPLQTGPALLNLEHMALHDCPPNWTALAARFPGPLLVLHTSASRSPEQGLSLGATEEPFSIQAVEAFIADCRACSRSG